MPQVRLSQDVLNILSILQEYFSQQYQERLFRVILFGSQARQDATANSDIDVLVVLEDPVDASLEIERTSRFIAQLCLDHNVLISRLFLPRSRFETENSPLLRNIHQEGLVV